MRRTLVPWRRGGVRVRREGLVMLTISRVGRVMAKARVMTSSNSHLAIRRKEGLVAS